MPRYPATAGGWPVKADRTERPAARETRGFSLSATRGDPESLTRYLNGTWALSPTRDEALEGLLAIDERAEEALKKHPARVR
jgi:hypothetical protein